MFIRMSFLVLTMGLSLFAQVPPLARVISYPTGADRFSKEALHSTGFLFQREGRAFVQTAGHGVYPSKKGYEHFIEITSEAGTETIPAEYSFSEAQVDLSLLELKTFPGTSSLPTFHDLYGKEVSILRDDEVSVSGYPFLEAGEFELLTSKGKVLSTQSKRVVLPSGKRVLEVFGAFGTYGMSGSPVFTVGTKEFLGMLTHRYLGATGTEDFNSSLKVVQNHLFVVPQSLLAAALEQYFQNESNFQPNLRKIPGNTGYSTGGIRVELKNGVNNNIRVRMGDGGADGINGRNDKNTFTVEISLDDKSEPTLWAFPHHEAWLEKTKEKILNSRKKLEIVAFLDTKSSGLEESLKFFRNEEEFFALFSDETLKPLEVFIDSDGATPEEGFKKLVGNLSQSLSLIRNDLGAKIPKTPLFEQLETLSLVLQTESAPYLELDSKIVYLRGSSSFRKDWEELYFSTPDHALELDRALVNLMDWFRKRRN